MACQTKITPGRPRHDPKIHPRVVEQNHSMGGSVYMMHYFLSQWQMRVMHHGAYAMKLQNTLDTVRAMLAAARAKLLIASRRMTDTRNLKMPFSSSLNSYSPTRSFRAQSLVDTNWCSAFSRALSSLDAFFSPRTSPGFPSFAGCSTSWSSTGPSSCTPFEDFRPKGPSLIGSLSSESTSAAGSRLASLFLALET